jgi:hypothetical protein
VSDRFPARRSRGGDAAGPVAGLLLFLAVLALVLALTREPDQIFFASIVLATLLAVAGVLLLIWAVAYQRLTYALTDSALRIDWLGRSTVVPYSAIQGIYTGQRLQGRASPSLPRWPGISVGSARVRGLGRLRFFATSSDQSELTLITVEHGGVIVSAQEPNRFRAALIERVEQFGDGRDADLMWQLKEPTAAPWTALADVWLPVCVGLGLFALLVVVGTIVQRWNALPDEVIVRFDVSGEPNQIAPKADLLRLPLFGLVCLLLNWLVGVAIHLRQRVVARLLWLGAVVIPLVLFVGVLRLVS